MVLFSGERSRSYKSAIQAYPDAWTEDVQWMRRCLAPTEGESILEVGAGSGYFSAEIAEAIGPTGSLVVTDPSPEQLAPLRANPQPHIRVYQQAADELQLADVQFDAIWSRGAFHHVFNKTDAFSNFARLAKPRGRLVICDIFVASPLARYFDEHVARACCTGHDVSYLSKEFAESLCAVTGWERPTFYDLPIRWRFATREDMGKFLHLLHAAQPPFSERDAVAAAERLLGTQEGRDGYLLNWPMTTMIAQKAAVTARD